MSSGLRVLITGGSDGLGLQLGRELSMRHFRVTLVGRHKESLEEAVAGLCGSDHGWLAADLTDPVQVDSLCEIFAAQPFDILVNNAGGSRFGRFDELSCEILRGIIQLNFVTPTILSRAFLRSAPVGATLVNVSSIVGTTGAPGNAAYAAAKAGLQCLTECVWYEAASRGLNVLDFRPVSLKTSFHKVAGGPSTVPERMSVPPEQAARALADAIEARRGFVYPYGQAAMLILLEHVLPKRWLVRIMGRNAKRAGYL